MPEYITDDVKISYGDFDREYSNEDSSDEEDSKKENYLQNIFIFIYKTF